MYALWLHVKHGMSKKKYSKRTVSLKCHIHGAVLVIIPSLIAAHLPQTAVQCGSLPVDSVVSIIQ